MNCHEVCFHIDEYAGGTLTGEVGRAVRDHLTTCAACREALQKEEAFRRLLAEAPAIQAPDDFETRLRQRLCSAAPPLDATPAAPPAMPTPWRKTLLLAASFLLAVGLFLLVRPGSTPGPAGEPLARNGQPARDELVLPLPDAATTPAGRERVRFVTKDVSTGGDMYVEMPARYSTNDFRQMETYYLQEVSH